MKNKTKTESIFPTSLFFVYLLVLLLMSGIHTGLIVGMNELGWSDLAKVLVPVIYWGLVALWLVLYARRRIRQTYEEPMQQLARATSQVAGGDFSVYISPRHTEDEADYLDRMLMDFNKMVEELGSIETLKTDFFSNVSHEFKSPLAVIHSNAELLQKNAVSSQQQEQTAAILDASRRLADLIQNMLKLNKLEKQTISPMPQPYDVCAQLCSCAVQFEDAWEQKNIVFDADLEDSAYALADPGLVELVWSNLLSNAIKFTQPGGSITLRQKSGQGCVTVEVADGGIGMDEETQKHIFDKFYQGDTSHATHGNGLGLALVKRIIELTEGAAITVKSEPQKGSVFTVTLPAAPEEVPQGEKE